MQLEGEAFKPCTFEKFSCVTQPLYNLSSSLYLQKQKFSCVTQHYNHALYALYLQKQKFSCVTQLTLLLYLIYICKSRNFLVLLNYGISNGEWQICKSRNFLVLLNKHKDYVPCVDLQTQKFSCVTQRGYGCIVYVICKSRNFLVLLNTYSVIMHKYLLSNTHINHIFCEFFTTLSSNTS